MSSFSPGMWSDSTSITPFQEKQQYTSIVSDVTPERSVLRRHHSFDVKRNLFSGKRAGTHLDTDDTVQLSKRLKDTETCFNNFTLNVSFSTNKTYSWTKNILKVNGITKALCLYLNVSFIICFEDVKTSTIVCVILILNDICILFQSPPVKHADKVITAVERLSVHREGSGSRRVTWLLSADNGGKAPGSEGHISSHGKRTYLTLFRRLMFYSSLCNVLTVFFAKHSMKSMK